MTWLIKTEHGYMLEDSDGRLIQWFDMAANSKAYCMEQGIEPVYLSRKSGLYVQRDYELTTGKILWWNRIEVYDWLALTRLLNVREHLHSAGKPLR